MVTGETRPDTSRRDYGRVVSKYFVVVDDIMEAGAIRQPDFPAAADGLRLVADQLALCPNLPALDAGAELMRRMDLMLEQQRLLNEKFDDLDRKMNIS